ncbi:polysaccharide deacetylase family protein, partial [bacterium]|nr:polysaccharide deacetylase family protein [bacterium]
MTWISFLHLYQPANSEDYVIEEATQKSYLRIVRGLEEHPDLRLTLNISGCLFLRWDELGHEDLIKRIKFLVKKGKIDITGTVAYHPFMPLISKEEMKRQIIENEEILKKYLSKSFKPKGFFIPEMAYDKKVAKVIKEMGYDWIILDEISYNGKLGDVDNSKVYSDKNSGLDVVLRSRHYSDGYFPDTAKKENPSFVLTGNDGEL